VACRFIRSVVREAGCRCTATNAVARVGLFRRLEVKGDVKRTQLGRSAILVVCVGLSIAGHR
jgi:hypothetical protein